MAYKTIAHIERKKGGRKYQNKASYSSCKKIEELSENEYVFQICNMDKQGRIKTEHYISLSEEELKEFQEITGCRFNINYQPVDKIFEALRKMEKLQ